VPRVQLSRLGKAALYFLGLYLIALLALLVLRFTGALG
jgi:hypothetical protein